MKRRDFIGKTGCGVAGMVSAPFWLHAAQEEEQPKKRTYKIDIEIYEPEKIPGVIKKGTNSNIPGISEKSAPGFYPACMISCGCFKTE